MADLGYFLQNPVRKIRETLPRFVARDTLDLPQGRHVSICFDDFPKSAATLGRAELGQRGWKATWYAAGGLMASEHPVYGQMFDADDLAALVRDGHDIGCHTYSHLDCFTASDEAVLEDYERNRAFFEEQGLPAPKSFAFPYGSVDVSAKRLLMDRVPALRGVRPGIHEGTVDRGLLTATGIEDYNGGIRRALEQLNEMSGEASWLVIFTHDIRENPSPWGCTLPNLRKLFDAIEESGADVVTVAEMLERMDAVSAQA